MNTQELKCLFDHHTWKYYGLAVGHNFTVLESQITFPKYCVHCPKTDVETYGRNWLMSNLKKIQPDLRELIVKLMMEGIARCMTQ